MPRLFDWDGPEMTCVGISEGILPLQSNTESIFIEGSWAAVGAFDRTLINEPWLQGSLSHELGWRVTGCGYVGLMGRHQKRSSCEVELRVDKVFIYLPLS
jgi:hypothetical protein